MGEITTKRAFIEALQKEFPSGTTLKETDAAVEAIGRAVAMVVKNLKDGQKAVIPGICALQMRTTKGRTGRNPKTGEPVEIQAKRKVVMTPASNLRSIVAEG